MLIIIEDNFNRKCEILSGYMVERPLKVSKLYKKHVGLNKNYYKVAFDGFIHII
jgi:hypothetical protein